MTGGYEIAKEKMGITLVMFVLDFSYSTVTTCFDDKSCKNRRVKQAYLPHGGILHCVRKDGKIQKQQYGVRNFVAPALAY